MDRNKKSTAKTEVDRQYDLNTVGFGVVALFTDPLAFGRWVRCLLCESIFHENFIVSSQKTGWICDSEEHEVPRSALLSCLSSYEFIIISEDLSTAGLFCAKEKLR